MKKFLAVLCIIITCIFGLTACGSTKQVMSYDKAMVDNIVNALYQNICRPDAAEFLSYLEGLDDKDLENVENQLRQWGVKLDSKVLTSGVSSYSGSAEEIGQLSGITKVSYNADKDSLSINATLGGSLHNAKMEIVIDDKMNVTDIVVNPIYSFGEQMVRAFLNTLMGMGTVFIVLILISLLIACLGFIPKYLDSKKAPVTSDTAPAPVPAVQTALDAAAEETDDLELVAVITAAIAACGDAAAPADGFVVRSIRKRPYKNQWKKN